MEGIHTRFSLDGGSRESAALRPPAISRGAYRSVYADRDVLVFERIEGTHVILVAVNRGPGKTIVLGAPIGFARGTYRRVVSEAGVANRGNVLRVAGASTTLSLNSLSAFVAKVP